MSPAMGAVRSVAGCALVALGVVGTVLPLVPGVPLLVAGIAVLGSDHPISRAVAARSRAIAARLPRWRGGKRASS